MTQRVEVFLLFFGAIDPNTGWVICPKCALEDGLEVGRQAGILGQRCSFCGSKLQASEELPG